jgi:hypothetical protein
VALVDHQSHSLSDHPEVGFSLLNDSSGPRVSKAQSTHAIVIDATLVSNSDLQTWLDPDPVPMVHHHFQITNVLRKMAVNEGSIKECEGVCNGGMAWV